MLSSKCKIAQPKPVLPAAKDRMHTIWDIGKEERNEYSVCIQQEEYWHNKRENRVEEEETRGDGTCAEEGEKEGKRGK